MRSARSSGLFFASHDPQPSPISSITPTKTHAAGQSSLPAGTNSNTAKAAVQARLCNSHFATIRRPPFQGTLGDRMAVRQPAAGAQTSWLTRVPCPGGSGAGAGGGAALVSVESVLSVTTGETIAAGCVLLSR